MAIIGAEGAGAPAVRAVEEALLATWPALSTVVDGAWIARMAEGYSGRANSLTVLDVRDDREVEARLDRIEGLYRDAGLAACVRETPLTPPALLSALRARGYAVEKTTRALVREIGGDRQPAGGIEVEAASLARWMKAHAEISGAPAPRPLPRMLESLAVPCRFLLARRDGRAAALALAACHRDHLAIHSVATAPHARRQGLARALMIAAFAWAAEAGARRASLFVEDGNAPALALYAGLGFAPLYGYRYHRLAGGAA
jgi:ribosomal protein S18 acetylase RimI-like enzyme